jgi:hypothetical protein
MRQLLDGELPSKRRSEMEQEPAWWQQWREGWQRYTDALDASIMRADELAAEQERYMRLAAAENAPLIPLAEIDSKWMKRMLFVQHRRPDAVASR